MLRTFNRQGLTIAGIVATEKSTLMLGSTLNYENVTGARLYVEDTGSQCVLKGYAEGKQYGNVWCPQLSQLQRSAL